MAYGVVCWRPDKISRKNFILHYHAPQDFQIFSLFNNEELFVNISYWGRTDSGDPIIQIRNAAVPMPTFGDAGSGSCRKLIPITNLDDFGC